MKKNYLIVLFALVCNFAMAQIQQTSYRGAFAPAPAAMWTDAWTNFDPNYASYGTVTTVISSDITTNTTWTKDKVYELNGLITVRSNATLTIQAGTVIRSSVASSALVITRGAKLVAIGTVAEPIVFTSKKNPGSRVRGDWGGIVMLGKARYNTNNGVNYIEGLSQNVNTEFGGGLTPIDNDNSGTLKYVRIEFAGYVFSANNELNGLTMGAVGSGTTIDYVQISYSNDDSFEWFGGSVNCKHLVAFNGLDDDFDVDSGFKGIVQFGLSIKDPLAADISTSEAFEVDNNAGGTDTTSLQYYGDFTSAVFTNITCIGANARPNGTSGFVSPNSLHDKALRLRRASQVKIFNSIFLDFKKGLVIESIQSNKAAVDGNLKFKNNILVGPTAATFASVNTSSSSVPTTAQVQAWFDASGNTAFATNTTLLTKPYDTTSGAVYTGLDYRPQGVALTGASFTDSSLSAFIAAGTSPRVVSPVTLCRGAVVPAPNVTMTATGVSLRWYTKDVTFVTVRGVVTQVVDKFTTTAPVLTSTVVGTRKLYVAEVDENGAVSQRAEIVVNVEASPLVALGTITGMLTSDSTVVTAAVGAYVGAVRAGVTPTQITYTVPASTEVGVSSYLWTVPLGVNIISGQGTNSIVVNYANVASGLFKIGNIGVQAVNGGGCPGVIKTLAVTAALPAAPTAIRMTDALLPIPASGIPTAVVSFAKYMGTTTPLTLTATPVAAARAYVWELPTGVNLLNLGTVVPAVAANPSATPPVVEVLNSTLFYSAFPFTVPVSSRPTSVGNEYFQVVVTTYSSGARISRASRFVVGGKLANNELVAPVGGYMAVSSSNAAQAVNTTSGQPASGQVDNTGAYGVFRANAVGVDFTQVNGVTVNPAFPFTSTTSNVITVDFAGVTSANTHNYMSTAVVPVSTNALRIGVKSINGVGVSVTSNATLANPATTSTARLLTLTAVRAVAPTAIRMTVDGLSTSPAVTVISKFIGTTTPFTLTAAPSATASSYSWELPVGVNLVSANSTLSTNVITVNFAGVAAGTTNLYIGVRAVNGIGTSVTTTNGTLVPATTSTARLLKLTATIPAAVSAVTGQILLLCGNSSYNYAITPSALANSYIITAPTGSVVTSASNPGNASNVLATSDLSFTVQYNGLVASKLSPKSIVIASVNGVGTSAANKTLALTTGTCPAPAKLASAKIVSVSATEVYPNPVSTSFNIDVTAAKAGVLEIAVYSLDGTIATAPRTVQLQEGANTINENISSLKSGYYIVQLVNTSNNEVITKKLIKN